MEVLTSEEDAGPTGAIEGGDGLSEELLGSTFKLYTRASEAQERGECATDASRNAPSCWKNEVLVRKYKHFHLSVKKKVLFRETISRG